MKFAWSRTRWSREQKGGVIGEVDQGECNMKSPRQPAMINEREIITMKRTITVQSESVSR